MRDYSKELMHVLIVDDDPNVRRTLARDICAAHAACNIVVAGSGEEALEMLKAGGFFNIFVSENSMLGRMRGMDFLRKAREFLPRSILILVTGDQMAPAEMAAAVGSGLLSACFSKPWHGGIFRATIQRAVRKVVDQETVRFPADHQEVEYHDDEPDDEPDPYEEWGDDDE